MKKTNQYLKCTNTEFLKSAFVLIILFLQSQVSGADCSVNAVGVVFSQYSALDRGPNNSGVGSITVVCNGEGITPTVSLSSNNNSSTTSRSMRNLVGSDKLSYNLYVNAARSIVWGDGKGQGSTVSVQSNSVAILSVYGQIPALQDVSVGSYTDNLIVTVGF